jgi:hypothetical protein
VTDSGGDPQDPFRTDGTPPPAAPPPQAPSPPDPSATPPPARRLTLWLSLLALAALVAAVLAPPVGVVLGIVVVVRAVRMRTVLPGRTRGVVAAAGVVAAVIGLLVSTVAIVIRTEIAEYSRCTQAANTVQAQQNCQDALNASLSSRFGLERPAR